MEVLKDDANYKYIYKDSKDSAVLEVISKSLDLPINITVTGGPKPYYSWVSTDDDYKWTVENKDVHDTHGHMAKHAHYSLKLDNFKGTEMKLTFKTSRETPPSYKPAKTLAHSVSKILDVKFFSECFILHC